MPLQEFAPVTLYVQNILAKNAFSKLTPEPSLVLVVAGRDSFIM